MINFLKELKNKILYPKMLRDERAFAKAKSKEESEKEVRRTNIINYLINFCKASHEEATTYLEIGVRNPAHNFAHIAADKKYSVDPGYEWAENPVDFKYTSNDFFELLNNGKILTKDIRFDVIFIDGAHLAEQVDQDIKNALNYIKEDGFVVLHDCNPPTIWHAREDYNYIHTPASGFWNGTTWKAFLKWRSNPSIYSCCIDTDWGVGILSQKYCIGKSSTIDNPFFEYNKLNTHRKEYLNLVTFKEFKLSLEQK